MKSLRASRPRFIALLFSATCLAGLGGCDPDAATPEIPTASGSHAASSAAAEAASPSDPTPGPDGKVRLSEDEWRARLTPGQFKILRGADTERPFSCPLWKISDEPGVYHCAGCGLALFNSADKFDSGTGWPSFSHPISPERIAEKTDNSHGMIRVETLCARCDGHLGHVFPDGPPPTGRRYCINGTGLRFEPARAPATAPKPAPSPDKPQP